MKWDHCPRWRMDLTPALSIVLPAHNEERNVAAMSARIAELVEPIGRWEILFIDDGSTDRTLAEIRSSGAMRPPHPLRRIHP